MHHQPYNKLNFHMLLALVNSSNLQTIKSHTA